MRMTRRSRSLTSSSIPNLRDIAVDSSVVMLAFINTDTHTVNSKQADRLKFGEPLSTVCRKDIIPLPLLKLVLYLSNEAVMVPDIFRRPGNASQQQKLIKRLSEGKQVDFLDYNFYTLSSVIKRFLLCIPGGVLGRDLEKRALTVLYLEDRIQKLQSLNNILRSLPITTQRLLTLLFGMWFRIATRGCQQKMTAEAMAKSVTGSIFLNLGADPKLVKNAATVMEFMIANFSCPILFGEDNLKFYSGVMKCPIPGNREDEREEEVNPAHRLSTGDITTAKVHNTNHLASTPPVSMRRPRNYDDIKVRQLDRLKQRRDWFLSGSSRHAVDSPPQYKAPRSYMTRQTISDIPCHNKTSNSTCCINPGEGSDSESCDSDGN